MSEYSLFNGDIKVCDLSNVSIDEDNNRVTFEAPITKSPAEVCYLQRNRDGRRAPIAISGFSQNNSDSYWTAVILG